MANKTQGQTVITALIIPLSSASAPPRPTPGPTPPGGGGRPDQTLPGDLPKPEHPIYWPLPPGAPVDGYYVTGIRIIPDLITVRGDPDIIKAMQPYAETAPVSLDGLTSSVVKEVTLDLPPGVTPVSTETIQIFISIQALQGSTKVTVPVQVVGLKAGLTATVEPISLDVILSGPLPVLNVFRVGEDIIVSVDATALTPGTYQLEPKVQVFRSEVKAESFFPAVISITIKAQPLPN